jgi:hypothetical protein
LIVIEIDWSGISIETNHILIEINQEYFNHVQSHFNHIQQGTHSFCKRGTLNQATIIIKGAMFCLVDAIVPWRFFPTDPRGSNDSARYFNHIQSRSTTFNHASISFVKELL